MGWAFVWGGRQGRRDTEHICLLGSVSPVRLRPLSRRLKIMIGVVQGHTVTGHAALPSYEVFIRIPQVMTIRYAAFAGMATATNFRFPRPPPGSVRNTTVSFIGIRCPLEQSLTSKLAHAYTYLHQDADAP